MSILDDLDERFRVLAPLIDEALKGTAHEHCGGWVIPGDRTPVHCACGTPFSEFLEGKW